MAKPKTTTMETRIETITPDKAREYLDGNYGNRSIRQTWVECLSGMIQRGEWTTTHQGIAFAPDGRLLDGQHRLLAILKAGKPVEMLVTRNLCESTFRNIDGGRTRSNADRVKLLDNEADNAVAVKIVRSYLAAAVTKSTANITIDMIDNAFLSMADAFTEVATNYRGAKLRALTRAPVGAAMAVYLDKHESAGRRFLESLISGRDLAAKSPILTLREALLAGRIERGEHDGYWKTIGATRAHNEGRVIGNLVAATEDWRGNKYLRMAFANSRRVAKGMETRKAAKIRAGSA